MVYSLYSSHFVVDRFCIYVILSYKLLKGPNEMPYSNTYHDVYPLLEVMAYAVMAQDVNDGYNKSTNRFGDESPIAYSNRDIILHSMNLRPFPKDEKRIFMFENTPDEEQVQCARDIIAYYSGLTFKALGGQINDFERQILAFINDGEVSSQNFGMIAALPKSYQRSIERDAVELEQRNLSDSSNFVGTVGSTIKVMITVMRKNYISKLGCDIVNAKDDQDNLVVFFTSKGDSFESDQKYNISARVKRHQMSNYHGGKETVVNYVKVVDKTV
jgi:hypothetical protein